MSEYIDKSKAVALADHAVDLHPYDKDRKRPETYSDYNQGWTDACLYIQSRLETMKPTLCASSVETFDISAERVHELVKAEKEGRLFVVPCKQGDTVYRAEPLVGAIAHHVDEIRPPQIIATVTEIGKGFFHTFLYPVEAFGHSLFLTREEAESECQRLNRTLSGSPWILGEADKITHRPLPLKREEGKDNE